MAHVCIAFSHPFTCQTPEIGSSLALLHPALPIASYKLRTYCPVGVLLLSWLFLGAKYRAGHFAGAAICVAAIVLLIVTDEEYTSSARPNNVILGDALVLFGASLYAVSNVLQEKLLGIALIPCRHPQMLRKQPILQICLGQFSGSQCFTLSVRSSPFHVLNESWAFNSDSILRGSALTLQWMWEE